MDSSSPSPKRKIDEIYSSKENTCKNIKTYAYDHLVQHVKDFGKMRSSLKFRDKSNHRALARYLEKKSSKEFSMDVGSSSTVVGEKKFVYLWKFVVVSKFIDISNEAIKEQLTGFKLVKVRTTWGPENTSTGQAIVEFTKYWLGFTHAISLESEYNSNQFGEKHYPLDNLGGLVKDCLYAWVVKEDDYYSECLVGENLRNIGSALKTIEDINDYNERKHNQKVSHLNDLIKKKNDTLVNGQVMVWKTMRTLKNLVAQLDELNIAKDITVKGTF
ncbi:protein INVOLVED IN DE NOVO 2-like [Papaver somniferum]|uniref:protein INVOLVED IN DE NOVO 2-like n=1 Tax=Papaver somniferum TaxID=3469 RepID=UPI000E6F48E7|nr:protein INVOLVED IN DE NOVO 2-like [Papaver somniferum]